MKTAICSKDGCDAHVDNIPTTLVGHAKFLCHRHSTGSRKVTAEDIIAFQKSKEKEKTQLQSRLDGARQEKIKASRDSAISFAKSWFKPSNKEKK